MGKHRPKKSKVSDVCRNASNREYLKNGDYNRRGEKKK